MRNYRDMFKRHKGHIKKKGLDYVEPISFEDHKSLTLKPCTYCGALTEESMTTARSTSTNENEMVRIPVNGIDRISSAKLYTKDNVTPCCYKCNIAKSFFSTDEFFAHNKKIYEFNNLQNK